jgi:membrane protease YdiL (CAAX protease family)
MTMSGEDSMKNQKFIVWLGVFLSIAITTTMDATGYAVFSALALLPLFLLFWWWMGFSREAIGFKVGPAKPYAVAIIYPILLMATLVLVAALSGAIDLTSTDWNKAMLNLFVGGLSTILVGMVTEEGFFRGWLWAGLQRIGYTDRATLIATSLIFTAWHISAISLDTGFDIPAKEIPIYLVNATLIGFSWGLLRQWTGSIVVTSVCHGVWNGLAYALFGFGEHVGALGIKQTWIFGPEVGLLGIVVNSVVVVLLWRHVNKV